MNLKPAVYIRNFAGLANRLESLAIAYAIQARGGHEIVLDWPELDLLRICGIHRGAMPGWRRWLRHKPSIIASDADVARVARKSTIDLRIFYGEAASLDREYAELPRRVSLAPESAEHIAAAFFRHAGDAPVVGVHLRRGDFAGADATVYDPARGRHVAVPLWWYLALMDRYAVEQPGVRFFVSVNGRLQDFPTLAERADVFTLAFDRHGQVRAGHEADVHPAADLFALACCPILLATPRSSFSHWAANILGPQTTAVVPVAGAQRGVESFRSVSLRQQSLRDWNRACAAGSEAEVMLPRSGPADYRWLDSQWVKSLASREHHAVASADEQ